MIPPMTAPVGGPGVIGLCSSRKRKRKGILSLNLINSTGMYSETFMLPICNISIFYAVRCVRERRRGLSMNVSSVPLLNVAEHTT